jgi:hypothetical protein
VSWVTVDALKCLVGDCSWVHTGRYLHASLHGSHPHIPCAGHEPCNDEMAGLRFSDLSPGVKRDILTLFTRMNKNPPFAMAHDAATRIARKYVLKEAVKLLLRAANSQRVEDSRAQIIRVICTRVLYSVVCSAVGRLGGLS